ncbi:MAG: aspartate carbamoyltransferase regulatory subunit [Clostridiales bacterium]|nr:aspartate carbamoyltransferase regulatory subunit [Clostridiales bacterium]
MNVDSIRNGYVIDHIKAGTSMKLYHFLNLEKLDCGVAIIKNVQSGKSGKKDIIKIDSLIELNLDVLGYLDPGITVNMVKDGEIIEKRKLQLPDELNGVISCKNPRCITSVEQELPQRFKLTDPENGVYRCIYCEAKAEHN